jgi:pilus assembly protein Flp/PilA
MIGTPEGLKTMFKFLDFKTGTPVLRFLHADGGATAIEYALIASGVGAAIAAAVVSLGSEVNTLFTNVSTALK